jgi:hypothetical protein
VVRRFGLDFTRAQRRADALFLELELVGVLQSAGRTLDEEHVRRRGGHDRAPAIAKQACDQERIVTAHAAGGGADQVFPGDIRRGLVHAVCVNVCHVPPVQLDLHVRGSGQTLHEGARYADPYQVIERADAKCLPNLAVVRPARPGTKNVGPLFSEPFEPRLA